MKRMARVPQDTGVEVIDGRGSCDALSTVHAQGGHQLVPGMRLVSRKQNNLHTT